MKKIESAVSPLTSALFRISVFDKIDQARPILKVGKISDYLVKKLQLILIKAKLHSKISLLWKSPRFKKEINYINIQYFK